MRRALLLLTCLIVASPAAPAAAQRRLRIGPTITAAWLQDGLGSSHSFTAWGGALAFVTGDDSEMGFTIVRYDDLSADNCERSLTLYALDSYFYPIGARGIAPFASTQVGLGQLTESSPQFGCGLLPTTSQSTQIGLGYGLGLRIGAGSYAVAMLEGRFFQVPNSAIQTLEARASASFAFGPRREGNFLAGTLGPTVGVLIPIGGPLRARAPLAGVRFRRDAKGKSTVGLQIDYASLEITTGCSSDCTPFAVLFAPGYETALHPRWGRFYAEAGLLLAGFPAPGADRGMAQGLHGGFGADVYAGRAMVTLGSRLLWLQRSSGENVFGVQVGAGISPRLVHPKAAAVPGH